MRTFKTILFPVLGAIALLHASTILAETRILASIKPLELLVRAIATEDMETRTLVPPGASPHSYSMAPSNRRALENADIIFWVGPGMETFLTRLLTGDEFGGHSVALMPMEAEANPDTKQTEDHDSHSGKGHEHEHQSGEAPHIWVDPREAIVMAEAIRDALAQIEGTDSLALNRNLAQFRESVAQKESQIRKQLAPMQPVSLFAYHSAFTRFAERYNLKVEGVLTLNPELSPGARHIAEVQDSLRRANRPCLLTEPQFNRQWWRSITGGLDVTLSTWDPLATDINATADGYVTFQQNIADAVLNCLPDNANQ